MAENYREHMIERKRTKLYAQQYYEELKLDSSSLSDIIKSTERSYRSFDTLLTTLKRSEEDDKKWKDLYYYSLYIDVWGTVTFHDASFEQIKNSGSLRYFTNKSLVSAIQEYVSLKDYTELYQTTLANIFDNRFSPFIDQNLDKELIYYSLEPDRILFDSVWNKSSKPHTFLSGASNAGIEFKNLVLTIRDFYIYQLGLVYKRLLEKSRILIDLLKKEYHLK
jgi:hypothetical protein